MKVIYKYKLALNVYTRIPLQRSAKIVKVAMQHGDLTMWVLLDNDDSELAFRRFCVVGTDTHFSRDHEYVDTVFDGAFVWHVLEEVR